jgi:hypothetical protein
MHRLKLLKIGLIIAVIILLYPTFRAGITGFKLIGIAQDTLVSTQDYTQNLFSDNSVDQKETADQLKTDLDNLSQTLLKFNQQSSQSWLIQKIITDKQAQLDLAPDMITIAQKIMTGEQNYVLLFQNTEELRATGGFLGSYAKIELSDGVLKDFKIEDIYVPDGQFSWFIEAPAGAKKYLSGGEGLRLRDANWHPDFPTSAQQILTYLAFGKEDGVNGAIAINLPIVEKILDVTGEIYIHDYDQIITKNNFSNVARADRNQFFPGSVQKQHFLTTFFNQLLLELKNLDRDQQQLLIEKLLASTTEKDLQFFSHDSTLQLLFEKLAISGKISSAKNASYLMLVESNVGINKANQHLDRAVDLKITGESTLINVTFVNHNLPPASKNKNPDEADHLGYVNYQRVILSPETNIEKIVFDNQKIIDWDEELISNSSGEKFKQIGFLITLSERETKKLSIEIDNPAFGEKPQIFIQKQSGLSLVPYHITRSGQEFSFDLVKDTLVNLDN